jgi:hypothetical protein
MRVSGLPFSEGLKTIFKDYKQIKYYCNKNRWVLINWNYTFDGFDVMFEDKNNKYLISIQSPKDLRRIKKENNYTNYLVN